MPKTIFTAEEDAWFDAIRTTIPKNLDKEQKSDYLLEVHRSFVNRFAWRHARNVEHVPCSATHVGLVLWGDNWGKMYERVRHKLNNKPSASKAKRPEGARIELHESQSTIQARHRGEGLLEASPDSPYRLSDQLVQLQQISATRTLLYERGGYGSISDEQRRRNRIDIPRDIDDFLLVLNANTGAELYVIAAWPTGEGEIHYYETATVESELVLQPRADTQFSMERGSTRFLALQRDRNALLSSTRVRHAPPSVYTELNGSDRPVLPLMKIPTRWKISLIIAYLNALWMWQGGHLPIPWEDEDTDVESPNRIVASYRMPNGMTRLTCPEGWVEETILTFEDHIYMGQKRQLSNIQVFQFLFLGDNLIDSELRFVRHPAENYIMSAGSRMYLARLLRQEEGDSRAQDELFFQFPLVSDIDIGSNEWDTDEISELKEHCLDNAAVKRLARAYIEYEEAQPLFASRARWNLYRAVCPQLNVECPVSSFFIEAIGGWWLPATFFRRGKGADRLENLTTFIGREDWTDRLTATIYGGPWGIRWAVLILIRAFWTISMISTGDAVDQPAYIKPDYIQDDDLDSILSDIEWLTGELRLSQERMELIRTHAVDRQYQPVEDKELAFAVAKLHEPPSLVPSDEEPSPSSPQRPQSILKGTVPSKKRRSKPSRVQVVIPSKKGASKKATKDSTAEASQPKIGSKRRRTAVSGSSSASNSSGSPKKRRSPRGKPGNA